MSVTAVVKQRRLISTAGRRHPHSDEVAVDGKELLRRAEIEGSLVTADALNTQTETARIIVQERGGDFLLPVKGNQKGIQQNLLTRNCLSFLMVISIMNQP